LPSPEPRQRWRIVFKRAVAGHERTHREIVDEWSAAITRTGLPMAISDRSRPKPALTFAAPLPIRVAVERDLADLVLRQRLPVARVRSALVESLPAGFELVDVYDVWLGTPPLAASVAAADYRIEVERGSLAVEEVGRACKRVLAAGSLLRNRPKGASLVRYDLRPLVDSIALDESTHADGLIVRTRTRFDPERGAGRPEEVIGALADDLGQPLEIRGIVRERVLLAEDVGGTRCRRTRLTLDRARRTLRARASGLPSRFSMSVDAVSRARKT
jgi:radical SAM-linked protein